MSLPVPNGKQHYYGIDWLRGIAALGIVGCHLNLSPTTPDATLLQHFCDMNVGVFGCISGFLLTLSVSQQKDMRDFIRHRAYRILPIYAVWTLIYLCAGIAFDILLKGGVEKMFFSPAFWLSVTFNGGASCHLWYLSALFYSTLVICPILWRVRRSCTRLAIFVPMSIVLLFASFMFHGNIWFYTVRLFAFVSAGVVLYEIRAKRDSVPRVVCITALIVFAALSLKSALWPHHFVPDYICAVLLVILFTDANFKASRIGGMLGETSLGVYLVHPLITAGLGVVVRRLCVSPYSMYVVFADWMGAYLISLSLAFVALRIPFIRRIVK